MKNRKSGSYAALSIVLILALFSPLKAWSAEVSPETEACLECHLEATPAIAADWQKSRHAKVSMAEGLAKEELERRISIENWPAEKADYSVGCAECHTTAPESHLDTVEHEGWQIHAVVTPKDCAACHPKEVEQYSHNKMANAYGNLDDNKLYQKMVTAINGDWEYKEGALKVKPPDDLDQADSCYHCHGTRVEVTGKTEHETDFGSFEFVDYSGWPNQGVGRINPDSSLGSCTACHTRHQFSIEMARKPYTCSQCHKGPDVPAYKVYSVSKHGNIFDSLNKEWDFNHVPWVAGEDFTAPTCAACHISLVTDREGEIRAKRTHRMNDRLSMRLLGLVYAHPQPKSPDTSIISNSAGLPLPTELTGEPVMKFLIDDEERFVRDQRMQGVCRSCHSRSWVNGHWALLERSIVSTNAMTQTATNMMLEAWEKGLAEGPAQGANPFDEALERKWIESWLFYANSIRLTSAMGGADYGVFDNGRWSESKNLQDMADWMKVLENLPK